MVYNIILQNFVVINLVILIDTITGSDGWTDGSTVGWNCYLLCSLCGHATKN